MDFFSTFFFHHVEDVILTRGVYKSTAAAATYGRGLEKDFQTSRRERGEPQKQLLGGDSFIFRGKRLFLRRSRDERDSPHVGPQNTRARVLSSDPIYVIPGDSAGPRLDFAFVLQGHFSFFFFAPSRGIDCLCTSRTSLLLYSIARCWGFLLYMARIYFHCVNGIGAVYCEIVRRVPLRERERGRDENELFTIVNSSYMQL